MNLKEIRAQVQDATTHREGESLQDFADRSWTDLPRVPYDQLPASLQKHVRDHISVEVLSKWLGELQAWLATEHATGYEWLRDRLDEELQVQADNESDRELLAQKKLDRLLLRVRNTATYTIDAKPVTYVLDGDEIISERTSPTRGPAVPVLVPQLYENYAQAALEELLRDDEDEDIPDEILPSPNGITGGSRQRIISDREYSNAFNLQQMRGKPYLVRMTKEFYESVRYEDGQLILPQDVQQFEFTMELEDAEVLDVPLLQQIFTAMSKSNVASDGLVVTLDFPKFLREMGKEERGNRGQNAAEVLKKIKTFEQFVGIMPPGVPYPLLVWLGPVPNTKTIRLSSPYMTALAQAIEQRNRKQFKRKNGDTVSYDQPAYNDLCHASIANERNKVAVLLVYEITNRLLQHGNTPDAKSSRKKDMAEVLDPQAVTIRPTYHELVNAIPLLRGRVQRNADPNKTLSRAFRKAYELLHTKTDAYLYYRDLKIQGTTPTISTWDKQLTITHRGRNPDYVRLT